VARVKELPELVGEFVDLAKRYVREQTIEPARRLGRLAGLGFAAALVFVLAALFIAVAAMRVIVGFLPDGAIWSGFGYVIAAVGVLAATGLIMWRAVK
jgi:hypothetical protein